MASTNAITTLLNNPYKFSSSQSAGDPSIAIAEKLTRHFDRRGADVYVITPEAKPLAEMIFDTLASFKIHLSSVAMHLSSDERTRIFHKLDGLLDADEWDVRDAVPAISSFKTFLRLILAKRPARRPSIGAGFEGHLIAAWVNSSGRLTIECLADDKIRWSLITTLPDGSQECAAGESSLPRLNSVLQPYNAAKWLE